MEKHTVHIREMLDNLDSRVQLVEERVDFTERFWAPRRSDPVEEGTGDPPVLRYLSDTLD